MPPITTYTDVLPLRAVAFQLLFLLMAIAIEGAVLNQRLELGRKLSMQYSATVNLFSTVVGWMVFFTVEPWLPREARELLIEYVFFGIRSIPGSVIVAGFAMFVATFLLKLQAIELLEGILGTSTKPVVEKTEPGKFRGRKRQIERQFNNEPNRPLAVLWANAFSFTAIVMILAIRLFVDQLTSVR